MQIKTILNQFTQCLKDSNTAAPGLEARMILAHTCKISQEKLLLQVENSMSVQQYKAACQLLKKRLKHVPMAYIVGYKDFYEHRFIVNESVLIPRSDTELLVDVVYHEYKNLKNLALLELGVGSGCIIISLLELLHCRYAIGIDNSPNALNVAKHNALDILGTEHVLSLMESNWFSQVPSEKFDIIVCNPPYISSAEKSDMAKETFLYEPHTALFAAQDGLQDYKIIANAAVEYLNEGGKIFVEIGWKQAVPVQEIFIESGYQYVKMYEDLSGIVRVIEFGR